MEENRFKFIVNKLKEQEGVEGIFILDNEGRLKFKFGELDLSQEDVSPIFEAWKNRSGSFIFKEERFAILKNEEIQFAAKNLTKGRDNIVGSVTKEGDFLIAHTREEGLILLEWSILVNKVAWS